MSRRQFGILLIAAMVAAPLALPQSVSANDFCSATAVSAFKACRNEIADDFWIAVGNCLNESDFDDVVECWYDAMDDLEDGEYVCMETREARLELCDALGEDPYDPAFDPADFTSDFDNRNPYWPLAVGNRWVFEGGGEVIAVEVLDETKLIEGVTAIVVNDLVTEDGLALEDTDDWYSQGLNGDVWYVGEISENYEVFEGDDPELPELVDIEGSWKTGRDGAKPGIVMFGAPVVGTVYRQEIALGDAEDAAEVVSTSYRYGDDPALDELVPEELAELLCDGDCIVTREFTPIEPGIEALKYYAAGIGVFLEVEDGGIVQLVECNVDPRCDDLPEPEEEEEEDE